MADAAAAAMQSLGFDEVRFTGGEPLMFENFASMVAPFVRRGLRYRVLTNGIDLDQHMPFFRETPPVQVTISVHGSAGAESVFGVPIDAVSLRRSRQELAAMTAVEATFVVRPTNLNIDDLDATLDELATDGVRSVKLILENVDGALSGAAAFRSTANRLATNWSERFQDFRISDLDFPRCRLPDKSFPSITLDTGTVYACCVQVGASSSVTGLDPQTATVESQRIESRIVDVVRASRDVEPGRLPCGATYGACPLALTHVA
jgi:hypothetical protein